jgi:hypothetical protein
MDNYHLKSERMISERDIKNYINANKDVFNNFKFNNVKLLSKIKSERINQPIKHAFQEKSNRKKRNSIINNKKRDSKRKVFKSNKYVTNEQKSYKEIELMKIEMNNSKRNKVIKVKAKKKQKGFSDKKGISKLKKLMFKKKSRESQSVGKKMFKMKKHTYLLNSRYNNKLKPSRSKENIFWN